MVALRDAAGGRCGGYASEPLARGPSFFGDFGCFVFADADGGGLAVHRATGKNSNFVYFNTGMDELPNGLAFGGGGAIEDAYFGLRLLDDLATARSDAPCATYGSPRLGPAAEFAVAVVEVWAVTPCDAAAPEAAPERPEWAGGAEGAGVLSSRFGEQKRFMQMAGHGLHSSEQQGGTASLEVAE